MKEFIQKGSQLNLLIIVILFTFQSCNNHSESINVYQKGDTVYYKDSVAIDGRPIILTILNDTNVVGYNEPKVDTLIPAN